MVPLPPLIDEDDDDRRPITTGEALRWHIKFLEDQNRRYWRIIVGLFILCLSEAGVVGAYNVGWL